MNEINSDYEGRISSDYVKKEALKNNIILLSVVFVLEIYYLFMYFFDSEFNFSLYITLTIFTVILPYIGIAIISALYFSSYVRNFSYEVLENSIIINHGVFTKIRATIPYKRIQNINIVSGIFDRMFKTYTIKIETAGHSAVGSSAKSKGIGPEGYIPGMKDPHIVENKINEMINKISSTVGMFEDKIFRPEELAFDNFISYILSKMREGELLKTSIKELREKNKISSAQLAEKVGVPIQTITYLEEGRYNPSLTLAFKIAEVLKCKVEELFNLI
ncbi:MAG: PH domain-containing protein [Candidatus Thorarchaeota archaeon]